MSLFEGIGKINDYAQMRNLRREMKYRIKTGASLAQTMGTPVQQSRMKLSDLQKTNESRSADREVRIRQKLRQGQKLSAVDMQYLKDNNPDLYEKVTRIEERRAALARALKRAKTKEEALRAVAQANISVLSEMQKGAGDAPSFHGMGSGSSEGAGASAMTAGDAAAGDALDAPVEEGAAPTTGEIQGAIGRDALAETHAGAAENARAEGALSSDEEKAAGGQTGPSTRDQHGNRRVLSRAEMDDMLRTAQEQGKLSPLDNEKVYLLRALQREWMEFANSKEYQNLPNTALDAAAEEERGIRRKKSSVWDGAPADALLPSAAEVLAAAHRYYHTANDGERFIAKG